LGGITVKGSPRTGKEVFITRSTDEPILQQFNVVENSMEYFFMYSKVRYDMLFEKFLDELKNYYLAQGPKDRPMVIQWISEKIKIHRENQNPITIDFFEKIKFERQIKQLKYSGIELMNEIFDIDFCYEVVKIRREKKREQILSDLEHEVTNLQFDGFYIETPAEIVGPSKKMAWLEDLGVLKFIIDKCTNTIMDTVKGETKDEINFTQAAKIIESFTGINYKNSVLKPLKSLYSVVQEEKEKYKADNPTTANKTFVLEQRERYKLIKK
jgi:hypothetical protein